MALIKLLSIWLSLLILSSVLLLVGYGGLLKWHQYNISRADSGFYEDTLRLNHHEFNKLQWEKKNEFSYRGKMFDVHHIVKEAGMITIIGHFDHKEDRLKQYISSLVKPPTNNACFSSPVPHTDMQWLFPLFDDAAMVTVTTKVLREPMVCSMAKGHPDQTYIPPENKLLIL